MSKTIYQDVIDPSYRVKGYITENLHIKQVGGTYGRFIFTERSPMMLLATLGPFKWLIRNCWFEGARDGI